MNMVYACREDKCTHASSHRLFAEKYSERNKKKKEKKVPSCMLEVSSTPSPLPEVDNGRSGTERGSYYSVLTQDK